MRLLATADLHIGRRASALPEDVAARHTPAAAWARLVDTAIEQKVAAVLIAGDLVDQDRAFFQALNALEDGLNRLGAAGIRCLAVAGNHDVTVLQRLRASLDTTPVTVLGEGGTWQCERLSDVETGDAVDIWGWSFPGPRVAKSPMGALPINSRAGVPMIGLLHCQRDGATESPYCPVRHAEFDDGPFDTWLLGHQHRPDERPGNGVPPRSLYLGSLQPLDPGEPGPHGALLLEVSRDRGLRIAPEWLASVRYETTDVPLDAVRRAEDLDAEVVSAVRTLAHACAAEQPSLAHLSCRVHFTGRPDVPEPELRRHWERASAEGVLVPAGEIRAHIERAEFALQSTVDIADHLGTPGLLGEAAALYLELTGEEPPAEATAEALTDMQSRIETDIHRRFRPWMNSDALPATPEDVRALAARQVRRLIETLVAQVTEGDTGA